MATKDRLKDEFRNGNLATGERFAELIDSMKAVQEPVADPAASGTSLSFIDSISQDADGKITATKKTLDLANAHELNPFKGWYKTGDTLPTDGFDGAYLYFKDTSEQTGLTTIYRWNGTTYADTGTVVDTSNVQTFATGQAVNGVAIDNTQLANPAPNALAKAEDVKVGFMRIEGKFIEVIEVDNIIPNRYYSTYGDNIPPNLTSGSNVACAYFEVMTGDTVTIRGKGGANSRYALWAEINYDEANGTYTKVDAAAAVATDYTIEPLVLVIPDGVNRLAVNLLDYNTVGGSITINRKIEDVSAYPELLELAENEKSNWRVTSYSSSDMQDGYIRTNGTISTSSSYKYIVIDKIPEHSKVVLKTNGATNAKAYVCFDKYGGNEVDAPDNFNSMFEPVVLDFEHGGILFANCSSGVAESFSVKIYTNTEEQTEDIVSRKFINNPFRAGETLRILGIGNSYLNNSVAYVDDFMSSEANSYCIYTITHSGASLAHWVSDTPEGVTVKAAGNVSMGISSSASIDDVLAHDWDIVVLQQYSGDAINYDTFNPYLTQLVSKIRQYCTNKNVCIGFNMSWPYSTGSNAYGGYPKGVNRYELICEATKKMVLRDGIDFIIPTGTAIENLRGTSLNHVNTYDMSIDGTHLAAGVAKYVAAGTWIEQIFSKMFGVSILGNAAVHELTGDETGTIGAQEVDSSNKALCQRCSFAAVMDMYNITEIEE